MPLPESIAILAQSGPDAEGVLRFLVIAGFVVIWIIAQVSAFLKKNKRRTEGGDVETPEDADLADIIMQERAEQERRRQQQSRSGRDDRDTDEPPLVARQTRDGRIIFERAELPSRTGEQPRPAPEPAKQPKPRPKPVPISKPSLPKLPTIKPIRTGTRETSVFAGDLTAAKDIAKSAIGGTGSQGKQKVYNPQAQAIREMLRPKNAKTAIALYEIIGPPKGSAQRRTP